MSIFKSAEWVHTLKNRINSNAEYQQYSKDWEWPIAFLETDTGNSLLLDIRNGFCKEFLINCEDVESRAAYVLATTSEKWEQLIRNGNDPIYAIISGSVNLKKGNNFSLSRFSKSGKRLLQLVHHAYLEHHDNAGEESGIEEFAATIFDVPKAPGILKTTSGGLDRNSFPMQLFQKAKQFGIWNPTDISFNEDVADWNKLSELEQTVLIHLTSSFLAGEESVTLNLLPLIMAVGKSGHVEEEIYLTSFLWEEAKHTEFFSIFLEQIGIDASSLHQFHSPSYKAIFYDALPNALNRLLEDSSAEALAEAAVTYNMIVEGTLAETGYRAYYDMLEKENILPGLKKGIYFLKQDESRHIAYGMYLLSRLLRENPGLLHTIEAKMQELIHHAVGFINEIFNTYPKMPFGLKREHFLDFAIDQFKKRLERIRNEQKNPTLTFSD